MKFITQKKLKELYPKCYQEVLNLNWDMSNLNRCINEILDRNGLRVILTPYYNHKDTLNYYDAQIRISPNNTFQRNSNDILVSTSKSANKAEKMATVSALNLLEECLNRY